MGHAADCGVGIYSDFMGGLRNCCMMIDHSEQMTACVDEQRQACQSVRDCRNLPGNLWIGWLGRRRS